MDADELTQELLVERLPAHMRSDVNLYDCSGRLLVARGQVITPDVIAALRDAGIARVYPQLPKRLPPEFLEPVDPGLLKPDAPLDYALFDGVGNCVARESACLTQRELDAVQSRPALYRMGTQVANQSDRFLAACATRMRDGLDAEIAAGKTHLVPRRSGVPLSKTARVFSGKPSARVILASFSSFYTGAIGQLADMWERLAAGGCVWNRELSSFVGEIVNRYTARREIMAALAGSKVQSAVYPAHCLATSVYCLAVALELGYNRKQACDLVAAAIFHDVGHVLLPQAVLDAERTLSKGERRIIFRHIEYALSLFGRIGWDSQGFRIAVYQHHERQIGAGYPTGYKAGKIHEYASVLAVADVFHALISRRPHRKPYLHSDAMHRMLKMGGIGLLDTRIVMIFVEQLSLYPIGSVVALSDGEVARVVAPSSELTRPYVGTVFKADGSRPPQTCIRNLSKLPGVSIRGELPQIPDPLAGF